jgi:hypothetical protein
MAPGMEITQFQCPVTMKGLGEKKAWFLAAKVKERSLSRITSFENFMLAVFKSANPISG